MIKELRAKPVIKKLYGELKTEIENFERKPRLIILILGKDPASEFYVSNVRKKGKKVGIDVEIKEIDPTISEKDLLEEIERLNNDDLVDGIMLQKPLPKQINDDAISEKIDPKKDVDAFHSVNMGNLLLDKPGFIPCTPAAVMEMIKFYEIETEGKNVIILGRSNIVGKPLANLLLRKNMYANATVTVCHSRTKNLSGIMRNADILIAAIGRANFVKADDISEKSIIIDVGINMIKDEDGKGKYVGDVDYNACYDKCLAITPVPGGVGSVTTAMLLKNVSFAYKMRFDK